jgi:hypothetical protein
MNKNNDIEIFLQRFSPRPAPSGVRERILQNVRRNLASRQVLTRGLRVLLIGSILLGAFSILLDWSLSACQQKTLEAMLNWSPDVRSPSDKEIEYQIKEMPAEFPDLRDLPRSWLRWASSYGAGKDSYGRLSLDEIKERLYDNQDEKNLY